MKSHNETCAHTTDYKIEIRSSPLSEDICRQAANFFQNIQKNNTHVNHGFIKQIKTDMKNEAELIRAIINGKLCIIGKSIPEVIQQIDQLDMDKNTALRALISLRLFHLTEEQTIYISEVIARKQDDI